mgnify:CR=1 FL=1
MHKLICAPVYSVNDVQLLRAERLLFFLSQLLLLLIFSKKRGNAMGRLGFLSVYL